MTKRLALIVLAAIMMIGVFGFTACDNVSLAEYKTIKNQALKDYADAKGEDGNYSEDGLTAISNAVAEGKKAIMDATTKPAVTTAYDDAKSVIDAIKEDERANFVLTISVDNATKNYDEDFVVEIKLLNKSGIDVDIAFGYAHPEAQSLTSPIPLFWPQIENWRYMGIFGDIMPGEANFAMIKNNDFYRSEHEVGRAGFNANSGIILPLPKGTHELKYRAIFSLNWGTEDQHEVEVWSNTLSLTVK